MTLSKISLIALAIFVLGSCAQSTSIVKLQQAGDVESRVFERLLVVDISSDRRQQQQFEEALIAGLRDQKVAAIGGYPRLVSADGIPRSDLDKLAREVEADGVLITNITSISTDIAVEEGKERVVSTCRRGDPLDYFLYDHEVLKEPDAVKVAHTVVVITSLYDTVSRERVWAIESTCFERESMSDVLAVEAKVIVQQLADDNLIR